MTDRLTARSPRNGQAYLVKVKSHEQAIDGAYNTLVCVKESFEKLTEYEETLLSPVDIVLLKSENARLEAQLEKVLRAFDVTTSDYPCPSTVDLPEECIVPVGLCSDCWRKALSRFAVE